MKKILLLALLLTFSLPAQTISLDLIKLKTTLTGHHGDPPRVKWRRITAGIAAAASVGDIVTTHKGMNRGFCELNPVLQQSDGCSLNKTRFTLLKAGVFLFLGPGEEFAHRLPHGHIWDRENIVINIGIAALYTSVTISNISNLRK